MRPGVGNQRINMGSDVASILGQKCFIIGFTVAVEGEALQDGASVIDCGFVPKKTAAGGTHVGKRQRGIVSKGFFHGGSPLQNARQMEYRWNCCCRVGEVVGRVCGRWDVLPDIERIFVGDDGAHLRVVEDAGPGSDDNVRVVKMVGKTDSRGKLGVAHGPA